VRCEEDEVDGDLTAVLDDEGDEQPDDDGEGDEAGDLGSVTLLLDRRRSGPWRRARRRRWCGLARRTLCGAVLRTRGSPSCLALSTEILHLHLLWRPE